jgi:hypothetical protein
MKRVSLLVATVLLGGCVSSKSVNTMLGGLNTMSDGLTAMLVDIADKTTYVVKTVAQSEFALRLFVAKEGRVPMSTDELRTFISHNQLPLALDPSLRLSATISQGRCEYVGKDRTGEWSGSFESVGLDYDKTLHDYLALKAAAEEVTKTLHGLPIEPRSKLAPAAPSR